ncbi:MULTISPECIES: PucR family transcriptional regulator [Nocardia]|uniref:PucR family transcriptional regulator n=1 Tax=Nocardia TaxID=1817 RepID=UPI0006FA9715|nr:MULTISPECIES: helix-turn-helix domain-containing protein [Nocardia]KQY29112.1 transcriptional regulator [Nocardia sp. Root136]
MNSSAMDRIYDPLIIADGRTASSFLGNADELVSQLVSYFAENVMPCQALPSEAMRGDVTEFTRRCLMLAMEMLDRRTTPSEPQLVALRAASAQHAREGVPVGTLLRAYAEGFRIGFELVIGQVTAADLAEVVAGTRLLLRTLEVINATVTSAYLEEQRQVAKEHQTGAQTMMSALLSGHGIGALTRQTGIRVAESYQVVALMIPELPEEHDPRVDAQVVARRKLRRVQAALADAFASRSLALLSTTGGTLLIPSDEPDTARMTGDILATISATSGVELTATLVPAPTDQIPKATEEAHELLDLVRGIAKPAGLYELSDVAIEYQLTRPGPAREHLADVIAPLATHPELLETLRTYMATGLNRKATGRRLHVHPNTIDYRLRRVGGLTDLDLTTAEGILRARIALLADDMVHARGAA